MAENGATTTHDFSSYKIIKDANLVKTAATSTQGRQFWTGGCMDDAARHLKENPNDVCMVRWQEKQINVMLGGPIPKQTLLDVTDHNFSYIKDSFDVGEMTSLVEQWFRQTNNNENFKVTVNILESGEMIHGLSKNSKLISLSRQTPGLLDMAATENGTVIGQYNSSELGHSGDMNSTIGGINCLHHELTIVPQNPNGTKLYFLAGYSSRPLKAWRDSRVFWIVYDEDKNACWLVPHDLSHNAVGDTVSCTMPLVSKLKWEEDNGQPELQETISVAHISNPVQASLTSASPLNTNNRMHQQYLQQAMDTARAIDWESSVTKARQSPENGQEMVDEKRVSTEKIGDQPEEIARNETSTSTSIDLAIAVFDGCSIALFDSFPQIKVFGKGQNSICPMHGPIKVLASGCCANSRVVVIDGGVSSATSEINSVGKLLSGVIFVKSNNPDIYKLHQIRWNMARGPRTPVIAVTPDGCKHVCGPMPPNYVDEEFPTPIAGTPISNESILELVSFALSDKGDRYFGQLYQDVPSYQDSELGIKRFVADMKEKDFRVIKDEPEEESEAAFTDDDFRDLIEVINNLSVSTSTPVERNNLAILIAKFLRRMSKKAAKDELANSTPLHNHKSELETLCEWSGDNLDWAIEKRDILEKILKSSNVKIEVQEGVEIDLALQTKLGEAILKQKSQLKQSIKSIETSTINSWKKTFNSVFYPPLEALMRSIGDNPRYRNYFQEVTVNHANVSGVIIRASQSTAKQTVATNPEDVMKIFHKMGATGFISFHIGFLQTWKKKVINQICLVDQPGEGFNNPETFVPVGHRLEDGPADPVAATDTDVRHQFVLPTFARLPKMIDDDDEDDEDEDDDKDYKEMPLAPDEDDLAKYLLMRAEFMLRDPEQGPKHPLWQYVDWLFASIKTIHGVPEKQAAPLAMRALGFSLSRLMTDHPNPDKNTMEIVASIVNALSFMSARGENMPHACIDTFFSMGSSYVPQSKDMERDPWQIEVINIVSRAVDYVRPIMSAEEYAQIRSNFQRAAANMVKRQLVQKLIDDLLAEKKKHAESQEDYVARVNKGFYPAYREIVETIGVLIESDPETFEFTDDLRKRIEVLHDTIVVEWAQSMRRCRVGPVRDMAKALKAFSERGGPQAMAYLVKRKPYLQKLYDQVYHIKYESVDHVLTEEMCKIIKAKARNPEHEKHEKWLARVDQAIEDVSGYEERMSGYSHGNEYKDLPIELMLRVLNSLKDDPASDNAVTFEDVRSLLAHVNIEVTKPADLKVQPNDPDGKKSVFEQLRGAWWMCPEATPEPTAKKAKEDDSVPSVALIPMNVAMPAPSCNILGILGNTYHKFKVARLFSGNLQPMRRFIQDNYKFHLSWFEDTIRAAGLPQSFDPAIVNQGNNEVMAIYAIVQRLVSELVQDQADRGDRARDSVYGEVVDPLFLQQCGSEQLAIGSSMDAVATT